MLDYRFLDGTFVELIFGIRCWENLFLWIWFGGTGIVN